MTPTLLHTAANAHIAALESVYGQAKSPVRWLVIAHNDLRLVNSLSSALADESAAVIQVSQDTWDFKSQGFIETVEWALKQGEVEKLVLVGSSQAAGGLSRASLAPAKMSAQADTGYGKLLAGMHRHNARVCEAQAVFVEQVRELSQIPTVHRRWRNGDLDVYGLFYRAESGLFFAYDADTDTFRPLCS